MPLYWALVTCLSESHPRVKAFSASVALIQRVCHKCRMQGKADPLGPRSGLGTPPRSERCLCSRKSSGLCNTFRLVCAKPYKGFIDRFIWMQKVPALRSPVRSNQIYDKMTQAKNASQPLECVKQFPNHLWQFACGSLVAAGQDMVWP